MGRKVKLQDTGEYSTNDVAFQAPNKKYWSSKEAFLQFEKNKKNRQLCIEKMFDLLGYSDKMVIPTFFYKKLKNYEGLGYDAVLRTMYNQEKSIKWALTNKQFTGETAKVMYVMAIIDNHVMDSYKAIIRENKLYKINENSAVFDEEVKLDIQNHAVNKKVNISQWIEEE